MHGYVLSTLRKTRPIHEARIGKFEGSTQADSFFVVGEIPPDKGRSQISLTPQFLAVRILTTQMGRSVLFRIVSLEKRVETLGVLSC